MRLIIISIVILLYGGIAFAEAEWTTDTKGCKAWNSSPGPDDSFTWSGECKNGYIEGTGVLQWYIGKRPDAKYVGSMRNGKMNGKVVYYWSTSLEENYYIDGLVATKTEYIKYMQDIDPKFDFDKTELAATIARQATEAKAKAISDLACSANVPNPNPAPNETAEFYGDCSDGKPVSGIVVWKQSGVPNGLSCLQNGRHGEGAFGYNFNRCEKYYNLIPNYCKSGNYNGQCLNGVPNGVGVKSWDVWGGILRSYYALNGQFSNGKAHGYLLYSEVNGCGALGCTGGSKKYYAMYEQDKEDYRCEFGGLEGCLKQKAEAAERERLAAIEQKREEARQIELRKKEEIRQREAEKLFSKQIASKKPQEMYIAAGKYEASGDNERAIKLYNAIIERFSEHDLAIKATDRLTRIKDTQTARELNASKKSSSDDSSDHSCDHVYVGKRFKGSSSWGIPLTLEVVGFSKKSRQVTIKNLTSGGTEEDTCSGIPQ